MEKIKQALVAGHICLDVIPNLDQLPTGAFAGLFQPGHLVTVGNAAFSTGGPVSNTGLALHILGIPTRLVAKVGADFFGKVICDLVDQRDPNLTGGIVVDAGETTSYTIIISPPGVDRIFLHCPGANDTFSAADIDFSLMAQADLFHFGYPPIMRRMYEADGAGLAVVFRRAKETGVTTSLDMAFPDPSSPGGQADWRRILSRTLPYVDIFIPSVEEILFMLHRDAYQALYQTGLIESITPELLADLGAELLDMGVKIAGLKLGHRGIYLRTAEAAVLQEMGRAMPQDLDRWGNQALWAPCFQTRVVGTTGAGDATIAGFLSALLRGMSPGEAVMMAVAVGACNVEALDALGGLLSWQETQTRIAGGWPRLPLDLSPFGWHFDDHFGVWINPNP